MTSPRERVAEAIRRELENSGRTPTTLAQAAIDALQLTEEHDDSDNWVRTSSRLVGPWVEDINSAEVLMQRVRDGKQ